MITFIIGLCILLVGGLLYGNFCEKIIAPTDNPTPAISKADGVDYIAMPKWKNCLIQLLNIAGTGPILGPIQGILFGPIAFITIPIGCVFGGALHDYMSGMISVRSGGKQIPELIKSHLGNPVSKIFTVFISLLLLLLGVVFIYTPGDLIANDMLNVDGSSSSPIIWIIYGAIFAYYLIATLFPIDKIIGKIYPIFGAILILSAIGIFICIFAFGYPLDEIWDTGIANVHPTGQKFIPIFFVTVACGIVSGFHSSQSTIVSRTIKKEKDGKYVFYLMMIVEGFIAMIWAAAAMGIFNMGIAPKTTGATEMVSIISKTFLGPVGGIVAILGVVILSITSGDTALRSLRLIIEEAIHIKNKKLAERLLISSCIFICVAVILFFAKSNSEGFNLIWRYFAWANQTVAVAVFAMISTYMIETKKPFVMALIPGMFYMFVISSYILNASVGFNLDMTTSYIIGGILTASYAVAVVIYAKRKTKYKLAG